MNRATPAIALTSGCFKPKASEYSADSSLGELGMENRRAFIRDCTALAASAAFLPLPMHVAATPLDPVALDTVSFETFGGLIRSTFQLCDQAGKFAELELISADGPPATVGPAVNGCDERFALLFRGDATTPLRQDTYRFAHSRIGAFQMFIVPVGREDGSSRYYEAVFHRPPPASLSHEDPTDRSPIT